MYIYIYICLPSHIDWQNENARNYVEDIVSKHCNTLNTLQRTATWCIATQHVASHCNILRHRDCRDMNARMHCNTLQHSKTLCTTLQHSATLSQQSETLYDTLQLTASLCSTLQQSYIMDIEEI